MICAFKNEAVCHESQTHFKISLRASFTEKVVGAIPRFMRPKTKLFVVKIQTHFGSSLPARFTEKVVGAIPRFMRPKTKLCAVKFRHILELAPFTLHEKSCWCIFPIYASKNEAVWCEVQTHFGSSLPASFKEKVLGAIPRFVHSKMKLFAVQFRRILKVLCLQVLKKKCGRNSKICASKNEAFCCEIQTHSKSSLPASFTEKVVGAIPELMCSKTKLFAVKFRQFGSFRLASFVKKVWALFPDLCVQKRSCLL